MSFFGAPDTLSTTLEQMIYHTKAVCNGAKRPYIVTDLPFGYFGTKERALEAAIKIYKETCADGVKLEGGEERAPIVEYLTKNGIAVMGHIGLLPQFSRSEGGYRVKGKSPESAQKLLRDAVALEEAGAVLLVIEGVREEVAKAITERVSIPTIGIGAGRYTTGQVLVWSDFLGFFEKFTPKFVKKYLEGAKLVREGVQQFAEEVRRGEFPTEREVYK
jgi:3-methyl-2-oxobutanoate hydroxymethyltransferase